MKTMKNHDTILFKDVQIGEKFFDTVSGEYWQKNDALCAILLTGGNHGVEGQADEFDPFEEVETV